VTAIQDLVERNSFRAGTGPGPMASVPSLHIAVVACMDARLDPVQLLGLRPGEAHVIRNAGGAVTDDVVRSLAVSQRKLGTTEVMLLHHTKCGMATFTDSDFWAELQDATGLRPTWAVESRSQMSVARSATGAIAKPPVAGSCICLSFSIAASEVAKRSVSQAPIAKWASG